VLLVLVVPEFVRKASAAALTVLDAAVVPVNVRAQDALPTQESPTVLGRSAVQSPSESEVVQLPQLPDTLPDEAYEKQAMVASDP